jgi:hypothetical protein
VKRSLVHLVWPCLWLTLSFPPLASSIWISQIEKQDIPDSGKIRKLPPSAFPELPPAIGKRLETLDCGVPQVRGEAEPQNVIHGSFARLGQTDWAVLCSRAGKSSILIFWGKPTACSAEIATRDDSNYLQGDAEGRRAYSRQISSANDKKILEYAEAFGQDGTGKAPASPRLDHSGIEDIFVGKASEIYYCSRGKWQTLQGAD